MGPCDDAVAFAQYAGTLNFGAIRVGRAHCKEAPVGRSSGPESLSEVLSLPLCPCKEHYR